MPIKMPTYKALSEEQKAILEDTELDENLMVVGPPGTGKTVIAMWRAKQVCSGDSINQAMLLMYNVILVAYADQWREQHPKVSVSTYHSWVFKFWRKNFRINPPNKPDNSWAYDWSQMARSLLNSDKCIGHLIVDEAQDLPNDFFHAIGVVTASNTDSTICVVADDNQRINADTNTTIKQMRKSLSSLSELPQSLLTRNYRNTKEIALLATCFCVGLESGVAVPPNQKGSKPRMVAYMDLRKMCDGICTYAKNNPGHSILVITDRSLIRCFNLIKDTLSGSAIKVEGYKRYKKRSRERLTNKQKHLKSCLHGSTNLHTGDSGTVTCVHWQSMKGLEADAVFVPEFEEHNMGKDGDEEEKMRLYVMFSRARQYLEIQYKKGTSENDRMLTLMRDEAGSLIEWRKS
jgi:hypothetical protein